MCTPACLQFFLDTGVNDDVAIDSHTNGKNNTGDTGDRKGKIKCIQQKQDCCCIEHHGDCSSQSRDPVEDDHKDHNQKDTDGAGNKRCGYSIITQFCTDNFRRNFLQFQVQRTDTDRGRKCGRSFIGAHTFDHTVASGDSALHTWIGNDFAIIYDINDITHMAGGCFCKLLCSLISQLQLDYEIGSSSLLIRLSPCLRIHDIRTGYPNRRLGKIGRPIFVFRIVSNKLQ